jgi:hypothetical protein
VTVTIGATVAARLRRIGAAIVVLVLVTAPFERWFLVRRADAIQERLFELRRAASARYPEGWQHDSAAVVAVADLEYRRARVRRRLVTQLTFEGWTLRLLGIGGLIWVIGAIGSREPGAAAADDAPRPSSRVPRPSSRVTSRLDSAPPPSPGTTPCPPP